MKKSIIKSIIWFFVFLVCGFILWWVCRDAEWQSKRNYYFPLVIFAEVAAYGSLILYEVTKILYEVTNKQSKNDDGKDDEK